MGIIMTELNGACVSAIFHCAAQINAFYCFDLSKAGFCPTNLSQPDPLHYGAAQSRVEAEWSSGTMEEFTFDSPRFIWPAL